MSLRRRMWRSSGTSLATSRPTPIARTTTVPPGPVSPRRKQRRAERSSGPGGARRSPPRRPPVPRDRMGDVRLRRRRTKLDLFPAEPAGDAHYRHQGGGERPRPSPPWAGVSGSSTISRRCMKTLRRTGCTSSSRATKFASVTAVGRSASARRRIPSTPPRDRASPIACRKRWKRCESRCATRTATWCAGFDSAGPGARERRTQGMRAPGFRRVGSPVGADRRRGAPFLVGHAAPRPARPRRRSRRARRAGGPRPLYGRTDRRRNHAGPGLPPADGSARGGRRLGHRRTDPGTGGPRAQGAGCARRGADGGCPPRSGDECWSQSGTRSDSRGTDDPSGPLFATDVAWTSSVISPRTSIPRTSPPAGTPGNATPSCADSLDDLPLPFGRRGSRRAVTVVGGSRWRAGILGSVSTAPGSSIPSPRWRASGKPPRAALNGSRSPPPTAGVGTWSGPGWRKPDCRFGWTGSGM